VRTRRWIKRWLSGSDPNNLVIRAVENEPGHRRQRPKCQAVIRIAARVKRLVKVYGEYGAIRTGGMDP